ncbi:sulfotransferase family protein [Thalassococcus sp. BH17M4-6]|uniref:sulfotransferase family protein n=1 Tax=Thalassococcus sp. BH17M4-6 TaxID=3413148 RepID=UPI003BE43C43
MTDDKTFILGVGASKCGTTWVQAYLNAAPHADFGRLGEYQVWDALHVPSAARFRVPRPSPLRRLENTLAKAVGLPQKADVFRYELQSDPARYFDYFAALLAQPGIALTGDITPVYARLPAPVLRDIDQRFADRGIAVKVILSLRDPIERAWSILKMQQRKGRLSDADLAAGFAERHRPGTSAPTEDTYRHTLKTIEAVFPADRRFVTLYETLFAPDTIDRLSRFAGVPSRPEAGAQRVNAAGDTSSVPPDLARAAFPHFEADYAACAERFPEVLRLWPHAGHLA